ncbi:MAG: hypothetical protein IGQ45_15810 [Cyanobacterium sp. T60_A2020_053]|nr:hypothetical protein [Cyanobacterium sp. T60_A2020_053]
MFELHTMKTGDAILICQMENSHLINQIKLLCRKIRQARLVLESANLNEHGAVFKALNPSVSNKLQEQATEQLRYASNAIQPYVMEAVLRNLNIHQFVGEAFNRNCQIPTLNNLPALFHESVSNVLNDDNENYSDYDDDDDDDSNYNDSHLYC